MKPNPTHKHGTKVYDCPYLEDCRYHVDLKNWKFWTCCECSIAKQYTQNLASYYPLRQTPQPQK